jgi:hypothetical protein
MDVIKDTLGSTIRRPCLSVFSSGFPKAVDGHFYWKSKNLVYGVSDKNLYSMGSDGVVSLVDSDLFEDNKHVSWTESSDYTLVTPGAIRKLFVTNSGRIVAYDGISTSKLNGANDPIKSSHIAMFDSYLLSNELSLEKYDESILFSKVADPITFEGAFFSAENKADKINALHTAWNEIMITGFNSIENFYNDKVTPFATIPGSSVESGTLSPWTIKKVEQSYIYLNSDRRVIRLDGRAPVQISDQINDLFEGDIDYENAEAEIYSYKGKTLYLITINDRTFVYDYFLNEWVGEWGSWNKQTAKYGKFKARNFLNVKPWGKTLCTDKDSGIVYEINFDVNRDIGEEVRSSVITGNVDHGTGREKRSNELRFKLKRGNVERTSVDQAEPKMLVRWRDNGSRTFCNYRDVYLGFNGEDEFFYSIFDLGTYRSRQYEVVCTDDTDFVISELEEDVTLQR